MAPLPAVLSLISLLTSAKYAVDPVKCAEKIASDICFLEGTAGAHVIDRGARKDQTCVQCLMLKPDIATWGCTLNEMREWCTLAFEEAPPDVMEEEKQNPKDFVPIKKFSETHKDEVKLLQKSVSEGLSQFATLLAKFNGKNPDFTRDERDIMQNMVNNKTADQAMQALKYQGQLKGYKNLNQRFMTQLKGNDGWLKATRGHISKMFLKKLSSKAKSRAPSKMTSDSADFSSSSLPSLEDEKIASQKSTKSINQFTQYPTPAPGPATDLSAEDFSKSSLPAIAGASPRKQTSSTNLKTSGNDALDLLNAISDTDREESVNKDSYAGGDKKVMTQKMKFKDQDYADMSCAVNSCTVCPFAKKACCNNFIHVSGQCEDCVMKIGCAGSFAHQLYELSDCGCDVCLQPKADDNRNEYSDGRSSLHGVQSIENQAAPCCSTWLRVSGQCQDCAKYEASEGRCGS